MTLEPLQQTFLDETVFPLMSSAEASPARMSALLELAQASKASVQDSGKNTLAWFASYDLSSSSWKTRQVCLVPDLELFSETWPRSGTIRGGIASQRATLAPITRETGFGLLPTMEASNTKAIAMRSAGRSPRDFTKPLPTLTRRDWKSSSMGRQGNSRPLSEHMNGPLNPRWGEWFMGFPLGWTEFQGSETRSSRKSQNLSEEQS